MSTAYLDHFIDRNKILVESFTNFKSKNLDIDKPFNALEALGENASPILKTKTAILMNNFVKKTAGMLTETSRGDLAKWVKTGLALISASHAEDITDKVISEQPLPQRSARIHFLDINTQKGKGNVNSSQRIFDALRGFYGGEDFSSEKIVSEVVGAPGGTDYIKTLEYYPIIPGSLHVISATQEVRDDQNGGIVGNVGAGAPTRTINYITGDLNFDFAATTTDFVYANYSYNIEAASVLPRYGISLRGVQLEARPRAIAAEWSFQAVTDLMADWGIDAEPTILDAGAKIIYQEKFKHVINHLYTNAAGGELVFNNITPAGISYREHIDSFGILLSRLMHEIWQNTQQIKPNVFVFSPDVWFLPQYTKGYVPDGDQMASDDMAGPKVVGTLSMHGLTCICDPTFPPGSGLLTYRGENMLKASSVLGMYIPLYKSPVHRQGFKNDAALLTEYAIYIINKETMGTVRVINL